MTLYLLLMFLSVRAASCVSDPDSHSACQQFTADKEIKNLIEEKQKLITPCPCVKQKIELDYSFEKIGDCYRQRVFDDRVKQMCCYSSNGNIQTGAPQGGYMLFETLWKNMSDVQSHCCRKETMCDMFYKINPSDDCSAYQPPVTATSFGDPQIETIDRYKLDFNGHGEYVFLKTNDLEIQVRLGYVTPGSNDATLFEAFAIFDNKSGETFEIQHNRSEKADIHVYKNGIFFCNANRKQTFGPCEIPQKDHCMVNAGGGKVVILQCVKGFANTITFTPGEFMSITIATNTYAKKSNISGLAGHQKNGSFICKNGTNVNVNSSAAMLFSYAESWSLRNETESRFNYAITRGNYTFYNGNHTRPNFLEDHVGNLSELFKGFSATNISQFNETCRNYWDNTPNKQCLLTIARSKEYGLGLAVMTTVNDTRHKWEINHNTVPHFTKGMPDNIKAIYKQDFNITIDLKKYVSDDQPDQLKYSIETKLSADEYTLAADGVFTWNVSTWLRYRDTSFTFQVKDRFNASGSHAVTVNYCGCDKPSECKFDTQNDNSTGNVVKTGCQCPDYFSGLYCEMELDPCTVGNFTCNQSCSKDNDRSSASWPCAPCPKGGHSIMVLNKQNCQNIDECDPGYSGEDKCEQNCNDTDGSFHCSCETGFMLNSNKYSCDDIDECAELGLCEEHEICINGEGSYVCDCAPGYTRKNASDACTKLSELSTPHVGSITLIIAIHDSEVDEINKTIDTPKNRNKFTNLLGAVFKGTPGYESVEVIRIIIIKTRKNRKRREAGCRLNVQYIVHWSNKSNDEKVSKAIQQSFSNNLNKSGAITLDILSKSIDVRFLGADIHVNNANETGLCDIASKNDCHFESTDCHDDNHKIECKCRRGYTSAVVTSKFCKDIDECMEFTKNDSVEERCVHGKCVNTPGSWNCSCPANKVWQNVGNESYPVYRCQGDYQYIGEIKLLWVKSTVKDDQVVNFLNEKVAPLFSKKDLNISSAKGSPYMHDIFLNVEYLNATFKYNNSTSGFVTVTALYILHLGESVIPGWIEKFQFNAFNKSNYFTRKDGTDVNIHVHVVGSSIFSESGRNLCNIPNRTKCDLESTNCSVHNGSYSCACKSGFHVRIDDHYCKDADECKDKYVICESGTCGNTVGSWECLCNETSSFSKINDTYGVCEDKNECNDTNYKCQSGQCDNFAGGWNCTCNPGYYRQELMANTIYTCTDEDECQNGVACSNGGTCQNIPGNWTCECPVGFDVLYINESYIDCNDVDECDRSDYSCEGDKKSSACENLPGSWKCDCLPGYKAKNVSETARICEDPCQNSKCHETATCSHWNNDDGYTCGCRKGRKGSYCTEIDHETQYKKQQTTSIAVGSSLGALVLILAGVIFGVCRWRAAKIKEAERIDSSRFKNFDDSFLKKQYMRDSGDDGGSLNSHRLSNVRIPRVQQNDYLYRHQNGHISNPLYAKPQKQQKPDIHGSMPNLANGDPQFFPSDYRRLSDQYPDRFSGGYNHALSASYNDLRNINGRTSPVSDYDRFGLLSPDYNPSYDVTLPRLPKPDYDRRERHDAFKDSGVRNGYSSDNNDYGRTDQGRGYPNEYRYSDTRF